MCDHSSCMDCKSKMRAREMVYAVNHYFSILSRNGLFVPSPSLTSFVSSGFAILDIAQSKILKHNTIQTRAAAHAVLMEFLPADSQFSCVKHVEWARKWAIKVVTNVFFNNERKHSTNSVSDDRVVAIGIILHVCNYCKT